MVETMPSASSPMFRNNASSTAVWLASTGILPLSPASSNCLTKRSAATPAKPMRTASMSRRSWPMYGAWSAAPSGVLEGLVEARHHLVAEGEVVGDGRDLRVAQRLRGVGAEGLGGLARGRGGTHEKLGRLALGEVVGGGARRDRRDALGVHVGRERVGFERGQRADDHVNLALLDQLARPGQRAGGLAAAVNDRQLDATAGERVLLLLEEQLDPVLHLLTGRRQRPGQDRDEADADGLLRGGRRRGENGEDGEGEARDDTRAHACLLASRACWIADHTRGAVSGMSRCVTPSGASASMTALTTADVEPIAPASPQPLTPNGLTGEGVSIRSSSQDGSASAFGTA